MFSMFGPTVARKAVELSTEEIAAMLAATAPIDSDSSSDEKEGDEEYASKTASVDFASVPSAPQTRRVPVRTSVDEVVGARERLNSCSLSPGRSPKLMPVMNTIGEPRSLQHLSLESSAETTHMSFASAVNSLSPTRNQREQSSGKRSPPRRHEVVTLEEAEIGHIRRRSDPLQVNGNAVLCGGGINPVGSTKSTMIKQGSFTSLTLLESENGQLQVRKQLTRTKSTDAHDIAAEKTILVEIEILKQLMDVPFICHLRSNYVDAEDRQCLMLDYADGGNVSELISKHEGLEEAHAKQLLSQLVVGIQFLHLKGIAHRDLKPDNLLLKGSGNLLIADFGFAVAKVTAHQGASRGSSCGTLEYMAPEVARGFEHGYSVDLWSLGMIIYEMVIGKHLHSDGELLSSLELYTRVYKGEYFLSDAAIRRLSPQCYEVITHLLRVEPLDRLSAQALEETAFFKDVNFVEVRKQGEMSSKNAFDRASMSSDRPLSF